MYRSGNRHVTKITQSKLDLRPENLHSCAGYINLTFNTNTALAKAALVIHL
jgi:hypothetical protein